MIDLEALKKAAALKGLEHVQSGMLVGLGTGSTARYAIEGLGAKLKEGHLKDIHAIATSKASEALAQDFGIPLVSLQGQRLDIAIDGMDEIDPALNAIKGLGGALVREKMVEIWADKLILVGDETKRVRHLGEKAPIPVEVVQFAWKATLKRLERLNCQPSLRQNGSEAFVTDNGNYILDCQVTPPIDAYALATDLAGTPGVVEHGLFLNMASLAYIASPDGVSELKR